MNFEKAKNMATKARTSVSAEAFGKYNKKAAFTATVIKKNESTKDKIRHRLMQSFMFMALDEQEMEVVIDAMDEKKVSAGVDVIKEGEDGDVLYVVEEG